MEIIYQELLLSINSFYGFEFTNHFIIFDLILYSHETRSYEVTLG